MLFAGLPLAYEEGLRLREEGVHKGWERRPVEVEPGMFEEDQRAETGLGEGPAPWEAEAEGWNRFAAHMELNLGAVARRQVDQGKGK